MTALTLIAETIEKNPLKFAENGSLQKISSLSILENFTSQLPAHCTGIRNLIEYLLLELVAKLSNSISTSLNSGKNFESLTQMKVFPLVTNLAEVKTDLKFQLNSKPERQQKVESGQIEER